MPSNHPGVDLKTPATTCIKVIEQLFVIAIFLFSLSPFDVLSHGTILVPESRIHKCRFLGNPENHSDPACRAAIELGGTQPIYDWTAVLQPNANSMHENVVPDGELCGGGNSAFRGLNLARADWLTTNIAPNASGQFEFIYYATAPHATKGMIMYVTKDNWEPAQPIKWSDMEEFCRFGNVPLQQDSNNRDVYRMSCNLPEKTGRHVIYNVWQRSDSPEAFYSCSDVVFTNGGVVDPPLPNPDQSSEICIPVGGSAGKTVVVCF